MSYLLLLCKSLSLELLWLRGALNVKPHVFGRHTHAPPVRFVPVGMHHTPHIIHLPLGLCLC